MKKKIALSLLAVVLTTTIFTTKVFTYNIGAYGGYSGAPGDATCDYPGCHDNYSLNSGSGSVIVSLTDSTGFKVTTYHPGSTYNVNVTVAFAGRTTFGFETTVRKIAGNTPVGTLTPGTGVQYCPFPFNSTSYITHEYSSLYGQGSKTWTSTWVAPGSNVGTLKFYVAGNAANGDGQVSGDYIYTSYLTLTYSATGIEPMNIIHSVNVYPNPCTDVLHATYSLLEPSQIHISVIDLRGKTVKAISDQTAHAGSQQIESNVANLTKGVYFLKISAAGQDSYFKIIKE